MNNLAVQASELSENEVLFDNPDGLKFDRLVSPRTAAKLLDVSAKFIYECIAKGEIPAERIGGRLRRIRLSAIETWLRCKLQKE